MNSTAQKLIATTIALVPVLLIPVNVYANQPESRVEKHTVFSAAPAPEKLAGILFPPRYRSADVDSTYEKPAPLFSMMINFAFDSARILPESAPMLQSLGEMMGIESVANKAIVVEGHTDAIGTTAYNQQLSEKRARAIKQYLVEQYGVAPKRLVTVGKGERQLYSAKEPGAPINRRATFRPAQ